jgi:hypothetical protein
MLLRAASEVVGGDGFLARRLGIAETLLAKFMADKVELPDVLLLRAVDIVLDDRHERQPAPGVRPTASAAGALGGE